MLVLTRKASEVIHVGDGIVIRILGLGTKNVKIGIEAPKDVRVLRGELCQAPAAKTLGDLVQQRKTASLPATQMPAIQMPAAQLPHLKPQTMLTRVLTKAG